MSHQKVLKNFIRSIVGSGISSTSIFGGFMTDEIPEELRTEKIKLSGETTLTIDGETFQAFNLAYQSLREDTNTEHLRDYEIKRKLWFLLCEVYLEHDHYRDSSFVNSKIAEFLDNVCRTLEEFEVLIRIHNFELAASETAIWDFKLTRFTKTELSQMGLGAGKLMDEFADQPTMIVQAAGNNNSLIAIRARKKAKFNLDVIRTFFPTAEQFHDEHFLFEMSETVLLKRKGMPELVATQWFPKRRPYGFRFSNELQDNLEVSNAHFLSITKFPNKLKTAINRAISWFGKAMRDQDYDDKIIALCAAMESLLTVRSDKMKGETLAYRLVLLNSFLERPFLNPFKLLWIYELRSKVIHGSSLNEATKAEYGTLRRVTRDTISNFISVAEAQNVKSVHAFVTLLETSDKVALALDWFKEYDSQAAKSIKNAFEDAIKKH